MCNWVGWCACTCVLQITFLLSCCLLFLRRGLAVCVSARQGCVRACVAMRTWMREICTLAREPPGTNGDRGHCPSEGRSGHRCLCYPTPATDPMLGWMGCGDAALSLYPCTLCTLAPMRVREACALVATPMDLTRAPCEP